MNRQTLRSVTLQTLENYRNAASRAVVAYHLGGKRLLGLVNGALKGSVYPRTARFAPVATQRLNQVRGNVSDVLVKGVDQVAQRSERAIGFSADAAAAQVSRVAGFTAGIENPLLANGLAAAARLTMPAAQVALVVSGTIAQGAHALADAAGARASQLRSKARKATAKRRATPAVRKAKTTSVKATKRARRTTRTAGRAAA